MQWYYLPAINPVNTKTGEKKRELHFQGKLSQHVGLCLYLRINIIDPRLEYFERLVHLL